jgi:hypothetical protein
MATRQLTLQKTNVHDVEPLLFEARAENSRLYDNIYVLQVEIERLHHARKRGKVTVNVKHLQQDLIFMEWVGRPCRSCLEW